MAADLSSGSNTPPPPQPLTSPTEIIPHLRSLMENHDPLEIQFADRQQIFQSYIVNIDRENNRIALDELIPTNGERYLLDGETFNIVTYRDGVCITWSHSQPALADTCDDAPCYWLTLPALINHHQRRDAYRADTLPEQSLEVSIASAQLTEAVSGRLLDISATGCKVHIRSANTPLQPGQLYEPLTICLPAGNISLSAELRHLHSDEQSNSTFAGFKFHSINGASQRAIERFVYQLQREARRGSSALF